MLTREEANRLMNKLTLTMEWMEAPIRSQYLIACINEFTEKSKREIKVGEIYRDKDGHIIEITSAHEDAVIGNKIAGYDKYTGGNVSGVRNNLDLSRRYKLVEVENE